MPPSVPSPIRLVFAATRRYPLIFICVVWPFMFVLVSFGCTVRYGPMFVLSAYVSVTISFVSLGIPWAVGPCEVLLDSVGHHPGSFG